MCMKRSANLDSLRARLAEGKRVRWLRENARAIAAHNERIERKGVFSDRLRRF
jgi:post-segregation antitoxin (ccd killing protein)